MTNALKERPDFSPVWGVEAIGKVIGRNHRQTHHMLSRGLLPAKRVGGRWVADRNTLIEFILTPGAPADDRQKVDAA